MLKNRTALHPIIKRMYAFVVCTLLAIIGIVGGGVLKPALGATNIGANPTPKVDIAVSVPSDYPGTFLDFKEELTQKLIDEGMDPSAFRITNTAVSIDTSNLDGWYVYSHYRDKSAYDALKLSADQQLKQPYRQASASSMSSGSYNIADYVNKTTNKFTNTSCLTFNNHVYVYQSGENNATNMAFAGYGNPAYSDWMIYPATSSATRSFSFNIDANVIDTHTLTGFGFFMNAALINGKVYGYLLYFDAASAKAGTGAMSIKRVNGVDVSNYTVADADTFIGQSAVPGSSASVSLGDQKKLRLTVELKQDTVTVQTQSYNSAGNLSELYTALRNVSIPQFYSGETLNGFGPWVGYHSHGCSAFSAIVYTDLEMSYEASAFDALKTTQYYQGAEQKYFINLVGYSGDPNIPEEKTPAGVVNENYTDGINRMNENQIFYISNAQDGKIVTDSAADGSHQGLGVKNGYIATDDDYVTQIAQYIYKNHVEGAKFNRAPILSEIPLANFYLINKADDSQLMTVHQRHLADGESCYVNIHDDSMIGTLAGKDGSITQWRLKIYDPNEKTAYDSGWKTDVNQIADYAITNKSIAGQYHFELTVKDQNGNESKATQTYLTVFLDEHYPNISAENTARNMATIKLVDTGQGIDEDGITFIKDDRGSGVAAYWITNDSNATPTADDWETITPQHEYSIRHDLNSTEPVVVWVRDECGNIGNKAVFQPTRVVVQDVDGNSIDDYIVIDEKPIIVLPDEEDLKDPKDEDDKFAGWVTDGGQPVTPGTDVPKNDDHTIIIRPSYAKDYANLYYLANGGTIPENTPGAINNFCVRYEVVSGNSIKAKIDAQDVKPEREGYSFDGWKLVKGDTNATVNDLVDTATGISTASEAQLDDPTNKTADLVLEDPAGNPRDEANIKKSNYYLVAQWKVGNYKVNLDANGGSLGNVRGFENIAFGASVDSLGFPQNDRGIPTKPGYIFQGWSKTKHAATSTWTAPNDVFRIADNVTGISQVAYGTMPAHDVTVYAVWKYDTSKFIVSFDSAGGSSVKDIAYQPSTANKYSDDGFKTPSRAGYNFDGWYLVDSEGNAGETRYTGEESITDELKKDHTFRAKWTPRNDTPYSIEYMVNTGRKDANGNAIYTKASSIDRVGTTEQTVSVANSEKTPEITYNDVTYWFNPESNRSVTDAEGNQSQVNNNVLEGKITGNPTLAMRLYYDRYLDVNVTKKGSGEGTVTPATGQKEGTAPTVTWSASNGSHVSKVTVDGVVRDDLISAGSYTPENGITDNVNVVVEFTKDDPTIEDGPSGEGERKAYTVLTEIHGCTTERDGCTITPTQPYKAGSDVAVSWEVCRGCKLLRVEVDGEPVDVSGNTFNFKGLAADHKVAIYLSSTSMPTIGGNETDGHYTITVNRYGGDDTYETSKSCTIPYAEKDTSAKWTFKWDRKDSKYKAYEIRVDGVKRRGGLNGDGDWNTNLKDSGSLNLIEGANHVVDIYFFEEPADEEGNDPDPVVPDFSDPAEWVSVSTQVVGGAGEIDPGFVARKSADADATRTVTYNLENKENYDDPNYTYYEVVDVEVDGDKNPVIQKDEGKVTVTLKEDSKVTVYVEPVTKEVETLAVTYTKDGETTQAPTAGGTIDASRTVGLYGNYNNIKAQAKTGFKIGAIEVTDQRELDNAPAGDEKANVVTYLFLSTGMEKTTKPVKVSQIVSQNDLKKDAPQTEAINPQALSADQNAESVPSSDPRSKVQELVSEPAGKDEVEETPSKTPAATPDVPESEATVSPEDILIDEASVVTEADSSGENTSDPLKQMANTIDDALFTKAYADGTNGANALANVFTEPTQSGSVASLSITNITEDQKVIVHFVPEDTLDDEIKKSVEDRQEDKLHQVSVQFVDENGDKLAIAPQSEGMGYVKDGADATISWKDLSGYTVAKVNGSDVDASTRSHTVNNVTQNQMVTVTLKKDEPADKPAPPLKPSGFETKYVVTTKVEGYGACEISPTKSFSAGSSYKVEWKVIAPNSAAAQADEEDTTPTVPLNVPYIIAVKIDGKPATKEQVAELGDIFKEDGNQVSDTKSGTRTFSNINDNHDVVVTTVLMNEDIDDDGKPDNNVDKDGDGKPDINEDTDGDGKPDTNVDTDDDGEPDVNVDTDDDGKPDINIVDEDGDGKPDPVDPKDPDAPKPNVNVDTDDDGEPDVNKDTDGDGKPDVNIVDEDGDGKPDPVDPDKKPAPKPIVNVDTDGDDKPDVNKDTDGDGKPDVNIVDEDGDGKPDPVDPKDPEGPKKPNVNVDTDDDGIPDLNIDIDEDGIPDINIVDKDKDGEPDPVDPKSPPKPDINIVDEDGDGKPDPVDPKDPEGPKKPNVNVDTDGDGKPDLNIDKDGDGKPDLNIVDKDGDGKPDPIDPKQHPAPEPDVNVDTDGDGWPDINIDTDEDGKPDKNVDTNGDRVYDWKDEGHPQHQAYLDSLKDTNGDGVYDWKDESHPDHQAYLDSQKTKDAAKPAPSGTRVAPKMGDVSIVSGLVGLLAAAAATTGSIAFVGRKRRNRK